MKKIFFTIGAGMLVFLAMGFSTGPKADADTNCTLTTADFSAIQAIQTNPNLTADQELSQELALRKQLLGQTITCATNEAQAIQSELNNVTSTAPGVAAIQSEYLQKTKDAINFYNVEAAKLNGIGINGSEAIAKEMLAWRTANYTPLAANANNFVLWSENQSLFEIAQNRLLQTQQVVGFIEGVSANSDLSNALQAAQTSLENADNDNAAAETSLQQFQDPDQSLALIQQSLQDLADTYQKFTTLNNLIQTLLPTTSQSTQ